MDVMRPLASVDEADQLAAIVSGAEVSGRIVIQRHPHRGAILYGKQFPIAAERARGGGGGSAQGVGAVGGAGQRVGGIGDREERGRSDGGSETIGASGSAAQYQAAVGVGGDAVAQAERPADAECSATRIVAIERLFQDKRGRRTAERQIGNADEQRKVGGVDEDLRKSSFAAGSAAAKRIVGRKSILRRASETWLGAIPAGAWTGTCAILTKDNLTAII